MSSNQSLVIYNFPILFDILNEIKVNLNFKLEHFEDDSFKININNQNLVVISGDKKYKFQNQIKIEEYPIDIQKLIELVNIKFLKNKFSKQNDVKAGKYRINFNSRVMKSELKSLQLTEKEMEIISFLNNFEGPVSISKLQSEVWGYKSKLGLILLKHTFID